MTGRPFAARVLTPESEFWKENAGLEAKALMKKLGIEPIFRQKFAVNVWAWWRDKRSQVDADGALKLVLDALNGIVYSSDKFSLPRWMDYDYDENEPRIVLEIICPPPALMEVSA